MTVPRSTPAKDEIRNGKALSSTDFLCDQRHMHWWSYLKCQCQHNVKGKIKNSFLTMSPCMLIPNPCRGFEVNTGSTSNIALCKDMDTYTVYMISPGTVPPVFPTTTADMECLLDSYSEGFAGTVTPIVFAEEENTRIRITLLLYLLSSPEACSLHF